MTDARARRGFTLLTVLWVMTIISAVVIAGTAQGRAAVDASRNRLELMRAAWLAEGCAARVLAGIDVVLRDTSSPDAADQAWRQLDRVVLDAEPASACALTLVAAGSRLDVNAASAEVLRRAIAATGGGDPDALAGALIDHRPVADLRALRDTGVFENADWLATVFSVEPGRVALAAAPASVLQAVPGITAEAAERIVALREAGSPIHDLAELAPSLSWSSADELASRYADASRLTTEDPDAWVLTTQTAVGRPPNTATLEWRLERAGDHAIIARVRSTM